MESPVGFLPYYCTACIHGRPHRPLPMSLGSRKKADQTGCCHLPAHGDTGWKPATKPVCEKPCLGFPQRAGPGSHAWRPDGNMTGAVAETTRQSVLFARRLCYCRVCCTSSRHVLITARPTVTCLAPLLFYLVRRPPAFPAFPALHYFPLCFLASLLQSPGIGLFLRYRRGFLWIIPPSVSHRTDN